MNFDRYIYKQGKKHICFALSELRKEFTDKRKAIEYVTRILNLMDIIILYTVQETGDLLFHNGKDEKLLQSSRLIIEGAQLYYALKEFETKNNYINQYKVVKQSYDALKTPSYELTHAINTLFDLIIAPVK